jgi:hypothetical protein
MSSARFHAPNHTRNSVILSFIGILANGLLLWLTAWAYGYYKSNPPNTPSDVFWAFMFSHESQMPFLLSLFLVSVLVALGVFLLSLALSFHRYGVWSDIQMMGGLVSIGLSSISMVICYGLYSLSGLVLLIESLFSSNNSSALLDLYAPLVRPVFWYPLFGLLISYICSVLLLTRLMTMHRIYWSQKNTKGI